eukprot:CAMPEP_0204320104 /NCGR_PEP_ID=MMETSP0469-20131031/7475_1 /ASSEMBLY_ACC=CAM_ASM_000384 /TAXON_ID=2969 /ORGANISM="Oxyrrhis marina" /LENGTH=34 /DNA_ID= /DNA_START= /DNA_END= /DNA_ORIENTATION=
MCDLAVVNQGLTTWLRFPHGLGRDKASTGALESE